MPLTDIAVKEYVALLTQSGTTAPIVTVLKNTIGTITWTRSGTGVYLATTDGLLPPELTIQQICNQWTGTVNYISTQDDGDGIIVETVDDTGTPIDGNLYKTPVIIQVYDTEITIPS